VPVLERQAAVTGTAAAVFDFLHAPEQRPVWDTSVDLCRLEGDAVAPGSRLHLRGRRKAPSWVGEYVEVVRPTRSVLRLVEGVGMPFTSFIEGFQVESRKGGCTLTLRVEYEVSGMVRMIEPMTVRSRMRRTTAKSLRNVEQHFA